MGWMVALLLKPIAGLLVWALLLYGARTVALVLHALIPDCAAKRYLFLGCDGWRRQRAPPGRP